MTEEVVEAEMRAMVEAAREICVERGGLAMDDWGNVVNRWGTYSDRRIWAPWWDRVLGRRSVRDGIAALERALMTRRGPIYERLRAEAEQRAIRRVVAG